jgi:pyruvate/2-oxoglutarate dehydrogenase complex dihydrolipoamide dehydrogenase (E3) component
VTLVEMGRTILPREDGEMSALLAQIMKREGVNILYEARAAQASAAARIVLTYESGGGLRKVAADGLLVAAGRRPNTGGLNLEAAGVSHTPKGIGVDRYLRTTVTNIFAAGDVVGPYQFSHVANYQAIVATSNALLPVKKRVSYRHVAWCTFTDPELARSGMTEQEAVSSYGARRIRVYRVPYDGIDRAAADRIHDGLAKFICSGNGTILGVHMLGERAGELMHEVHAAKSLGIKLHRLNSVIHAYPTYNDIIRIAARQAYVDKIRNNPAVRLVQLLRRGK